MSEVRVVRDGVAITAIDEGRGPTVLVVHPGGSDAASWDAVAALLTDEFRVVRMQRRIYASVAAAIPAHAMAVETGDILALAAALAPPRLLVGHSSGAVAALEAALRAPSLFAGILAYEPPMPTRSLVAGEAGRRARRAFEAGDASEAMRIHIRDVVGLPDRLVDDMFADPRGRAALVARVAAQIADCEAIDALGVGVERYRSLSLPVTLVEGDRSPAHLRQRLADLAAALPSARVVTLAGQGHVAHITAPAALAGAIRDLAHRVLPEPGRCAATHSRDAEPRGPGSS